MYPIIHCPNPYCVILHNKCYNRSVLCLLHQCLLKGGSIFPRQGAQLGLLGGQAKVVKALDYRP